MLEKRMTTVLTRIQVEHHGERLMPQLLFHAGRL